MINKSIVETRIRLCKLHLFISVFFYIIVCLLGFEMNFNLMVGYGVYTFFITTLLLKSEMRFEGFTLVILFLAGSYLRLIIPTISNAMLASNGALIKLRYDYTDAIFPCAIAMNIYYMLFLLLLTFFSKSNRILNVDLTSLLQKKHFLRTILLLFSWGVFYTIYSNLFSIGFVGVFLDGFSTMALLMLAFVSVYKSEKKYIYTFYLLIVLEIVRSVVWGFYKGAIIQPVFIFAIHYYLYCRYNRKPIFTLKTIAILTFSILFMLGFVYPFINAKRYAAEWDPTNGITKDFDVKEIVLTVFENRDKLIDEDQSDILLVRFDALTPNAYFYKLVQKDGINPIVLYASIRQFWPKWLGRDTDQDNLLKPGYVVNSYMEYGYLRQLDSFSSNYIGSFASGYFWGWWIGVFIVCIFNAYVISWLLRFCTSHSTYYLCMLVMTSIVLESFGCYEEVKSGGISRAIIWFLFIIVLKFYVSLKRFRHVQRFI